MKTLCLALILPVLAVSCASDSGSGSSTSTAGKSAPARKKISERITEDNGYKQDANGKWVPRSDRRSPFESQGEVSFAKKGFKKQEYKTGDFDKKSWWGNKKYDRKAYDGKTDGNRFQQTAAQEGKSARETTSTVNLPGKYKTEGYATNAAREAGQAGVEKGSNAIIDNRQEVFQQPEIIDWREQRTMTMDQSRSILGR